MMRAARLTCCGVITVSLLSSCSSGDADQACKEAAVKASKFVAEKNFSQAESAYRQAIELARKSDNALQYPLMLRELAKCYIDQHKYNEAENFLQQTVDAYSELLKNSNSHSDVSTMRERQYEAQILKADCLMSDGKFADARAAYEAALASSKKFVESMSTTSAVNQKYISALRACGQTELANQFEIQAKAAAITLDDFDKRLGAASALIYKGKFAAAEKELDILLAAAKGFYGANPRVGRVLTYVALCQLTHNEPVNAQVSIEEALRNSKSFADPVADLSGDYALRGLCKEFCGDTISGIADYRVGFKIEHFHPGVILSLVADGLRRNGFAERANLVLARIKWFKSDPQFRIEPITAYQYGLLADEQHRNRQSALSDETRLRALTHLESSDKLTDVDELRGAFQLFKFYRKAGKPDLAQRALKQMRLVGMRTANGRIQLEQALRYEHVSDD